MKTINHCSTIYSCINTHTLLLLTNLHEYFFREGTILYEHSNGVTIQVSCENDDKNAKGCAPNSVEVYLQETLVKRASYCC